MADRSFLAPPDEVLDRRRVILTAAAIRNGLFAALPGTESDIAGRSGLDADATRALLDALAVWQIIDRDGDIYAEGTLTPRDLGSPIQKNGSF